MAADRSDAPGTIVETVVVEKSTVSIRRIWPPPAPKRAPSGPTVSAVNGEEALRVFTVETAPVVNDIRRRQLASA